MRIPAAIGFGCVLFNGAAKALSRSKTPSNNKKLIQSIGIIGSGISGLATAHALASMDSSLQLSIYDSRPGLDPLVGAGIQLNGGLKVLGDIDPKLQQAVIAAGLPLGKIQSKTRTNNQLETLIELPLKETVQNSGKTELLSRQDGSVLWTSIMRGTLQQTLFDTLPKTLRQRVAFKKTLTDIIAAEDRQVYCLFADGTKSGPFDLIIGCDGIKSVVKQYVVNGRVSSNAAESQTGLYTGIRMRYAVQSKSASKKANKSAPITFTQYFGDACYCLDGTYGAGSAVTKSVFAIFLDNEFFGPLARRTESEACDENVDWSQNNLQTDNKGARQIMLQQLQNANLLEAPLVSTIQQADRFFELGIYVHNPFCQWSREISGSAGVHAVVCGDAAHALPPFLGQGSNQAIQDAYCLATRIQRYNKAVEKDQDNTVTVASFLKEYETIRWMPNFQIFWKAAFLGYLETGGFDGFYSTFRNIFFKTMGVIGVAQKVLLSAATPKVD
jgi:2-polyprenyl-6-methoxyphenol hydroxylase-like FAD-dependent oxidoreductase